MLSKGGWAVFLVLGLASGTAAASASDLDVVYGATEISLPINAGLMLTLSTPEGEKNFLIGKASEERQSVSKAQILDLLTHGSSLIEARISLHEACESGFVVSALCEHTRNDYTEKFVVYDVSIRPFDGNLSSSRAADGAGFGPLEMTKSGLGFRFITFEGSVLDKLTSKAAVLYCTVYIANDAVIQFRVFLRNPPQPDLVQLEKLLREHVVDVLSALTKVREK
jgi:hypothetical protein